MSSFPVYGVALAVAAILLTASDGSGMATGKHNFDHNYLA